MLLMNQGWPLGSPPPFTALQPNTASPQYDGLLHWWPTLNMSGFHIPDLVGKITLEPTNGTPVTQLTSHFGQVVYCSSAGNDWQGTIPDPSFAKAITVSAWFSLDDTSGDQTIFQVQNTFRLRTSGAALEGYVRTASQQSVTGTSTLSAGPKYHAVVRYDGANVEFFLNAGSEGTNADADTITAPGAPVIVGAQQLFGNRFQGQIWDLRIYKKALSNAEIVDLYRPQTRWELYRVMLPIVLAKAPAAVSGSPWYQYLQQAG